MLNTEITDGIEEFEIIKAEELERKTGKYVGGFGHTDQLMRVVSLDVSFEFSIYRVRQRNGKRGGSTARIWLLKRIYANGLLIKTRITKFHCEVLNKLKWSERLDYCANLIDGAKKKTIEYEEAQNNDSK